MWAFIFGAVYMHSHIKQSHQSQFKKKSFFLKHPVYSCECALSSEAVHVVEKISEILLNCVRTDRSDKLNKFTVRNRVCAVCTCAANGRHCFLLGCGGSLRNEAQFNCISGRWTFWPKFVLGCSNIHALNASYGNSHSVRRCINNYLDQSAIRMPVADWSNLASAQCLQTRFQSADGALLLTKLTAAPWFCHKNLALAKISVSGPAECPRMRKSRFLGDKLHYLTAPPQG